MAMKSFWKCKIFAVTDRQRDAIPLLESEFKADLDLERLPSGKFATNTLIFNLAGLVYNVLKYLGSVAESKDVQMKRHAAKRRRIRTIIQEVINVPVMLARPSKKKGVPQKILPSFVQYSRRVPKTASCIEGWARQDSAIHGFRAR